MNSNRAPLVQHGMIRSLLLVASMSSVAALADGGTAPASCKAAGCGPSQVCQVAAGADACNASGTCVARPEFCPQVVAPVCGCDGKTYDNGCLAQKAGVTVKSSNVCGAASGCASSSDCGAKQVCRFPSSDVCGEGGQRGSCVDKPFACPKLAAPVCGCDGKTYANSCEAHVAGVNVRTKSKCP